MKVLFVSNCRGFSGAEIVLARMIRNNKFLSPVAMVPQGAFSKKLKEVGCKVSFSKGLREISRSNRLWLVSAIYGLILFFLESIFVIVREKPALIHANGYIAGVFCFIPSALLRIPLVLHIHDMFNVGTLEGRLCSFLGNRANTVVAVSYAVKKRLEILGVPKNKIEVVYNGIDCNLEFNPNEFTAKRSSGTINIGMIGLIVEWKGFHIFLESLKKLDSTLNYHAYIIGDSWLGERNQYKERIYELACNPSIYKKVTFLGFRDDTPQVLSDLDIVIHASTRDDPLPTVILEAMAMQKIVIASDVGGVREMIDHKENGYIYPAGDARKLAEILHEVINNYYDLNYIRNNARDKIFTFFTENETKFIMNNVYKNLKLKDNVSANIGCDS